MSSCLKIKHADKSFHMIPPCISNGMMFSRSPKRGIIRGMLLPIQSRNSSSHLPHTFLLVNTFSFLSTLLLLTNLPKPAELTFCRQSTVRKYSITMNQMPDQGSNFFTPFPSRIRGAGWWVACRGRIRWNLTC